MLAGLCYGAGFHSYIAYRATPAIVMVVLGLFFLECRKAGRLREWTLGTAGFLLMALLACSPLLVYFARHPGTFTGRVKEVSVLNSKSPWSDVAKNTWKTALMFNVSGDQSWRHNVSKRPEIFLPVGLLFLWGGGLAVAKFKAAPLPHAVALVWLVVGVLPAVLSNESVPHALRSLVAAPACFMLAGFAANRLWLWSSSRFSTSKTAYAGMLVAVALTGEAYHTYFFTFARNPKVQVPFQAAWTELAREINAEPDGVRKNLIVPGEPVDKRGVPLGVYSARSVDWKL